MLMMGWAKRFAMLRVPQRADREGTVSLVFAITLIPMLMLVGLAVDFGFYAEAASQLNLAADSAAMHAVRIAVQLYEQGDSPTKASNLAKTAGTNWFEAQLGNVPQAKKLYPPSIAVSFSKSGTQVSAQVSYSGVISTHFGRLFPGSWREYPNWGIQGAATAVISTLTYNEFDFLVDNSSSMLIASDAKNIQRMEDLTPCSSQAAAVEGVSLQGLVGSFSWYYAIQNGNPTDLSAQTPPDATATPIPYGYGIFQYQATSGANAGKTEYINQILPSSTKRTGECDPAFSAGAAAGGYARECFYVPIASSGITPPIAGSGLCSAGGGTSARLGAPGPQPNLSTQITLQNVPQAPCAFACHTDASGQNNDYFGLARANNIQLRFDVVQNALTANPGGVIPTLETYVQNSGNLNPVTVGVYYFNSTFTTAVAPSPTTNSLQALQQAETIESGIEPQPGPDVPNTDFPDAMTAMFNIYNAAGKVGSGNLPTQPKKNLFIVTDGMQDYPVPNPTGVACPVAGSGLQIGDGNYCRSQGPITLDQCTSIKKLGVTIYVLYTTYYPLPNPYYLTNDAQWVEPTGKTSAIYKNLAACASPGTPQYPTILEASNASDIGPALNKLLQSALSSPGRLSN